MDGMGYSSPPLSLKPTAGWLGPHGAHSCSSTLGVSFPGGLSLSLLAPQAQRYSEDCPVLADFPKPAHLLVNVS